MCIASESATALFQLFLTLPSHAPSAKPFVRLSRHVHVIEGEGGKEKDVIGTEEREACGEACACFVLNFVSFVL